MSTQNSRSYQRAFSLNKQANIFTAVASAQINKMRSTRGFGPITESEGKISDRSWYGKGHTFSTFAERFSKQYVIPAAESSATSLEALFAAAFVMGNVVTTQPNSATKPLEYQHVVTFQDVIANKEVLYTSLIEKVGTEYQKLLSGAWLSQFTLTGERTDHVRLSYEGGGRKYADSVASLPASVTSSAILKTLLGTVAFGDSGALGDISAEVLSWNLTVNQDPQPMLLMGNSIGDEMLIREVLIGQQSVGGQCVIKVSAAHRDRFLNQTTCGIQIVCKSSDVVTGTTDPHSLTISIPNLKLANEAFGEEGSSITYTLAFGEDNVLKVGATAPVTLTFINDIDATELLVAA
jgi:hypothetical protein